jgi:hypothetical protein
MYGGTEEVQRPNCDGKPPIKEEIQINVNGVSGNRSPFKTPFNTRTHISRPPQHPILYTLAIITDCTTLPSSCFFPTLHQHTRHRNSAAKAHLPPRMTMHQYPIAYEDAMMMMMDDGTLILFSSQHTTNTHKLCPSPPPTPTPCSCHIEKRIRLHKTLLILFLPPLHQNSMMKSSPHDHAPILHAHKDTMLMMMEDDGALI